ncbi:hypothetical protein [Hellea balneolensis]|uniref:hypothetical protein n=1 Tax=Hellea balneolensis TaxID=287478 RepID=UPI00042136C5|nr:hypothetical protein [Hellea balneolensis]
MKYLSAFVILAVLMPQSAMAADKLRGEVFCFPAKDVPKIVNNLKDVKDSRRDVVDVDINPKFIIKDGGIWPERFFLRTDNGEIDIPVEKPSGLTPSFLENAFAYPESDVCVADKTRAARPEYDEGLYFEMGLSPLFHDNSGRHDMASLKEGTKDGKSFYKKMIPSVARMFMPDTDYLAVKYDDLRTTGAQIFALVNGNEVPLDAELYKEMHVVSFEALEDMDASALIIKGGAYELQPTVSVKTMKRFGWGQEEDEE